MARCGCKAVCSCLVQAGDCTTVQGSGALDNPYIISVEVLPDGGITCTPGGLAAEVNVADTPCINLEGDGGLNPITATLTVAPDSADPNGGPNPGNGLECSPTGALVAPSTEAGNAVRYGTDGRLYVPAGATEVDTDQTDCLDLQISGSGIVGDPFVISGSPILNPACPQIQCTPQGLCVDVQVQALDTPTVDITVTGTGQAGDPFIISADALGATIIDNAQNVDVVEGPDNTFTVTCVPVPVVSNDPTCLQVSGDTCAGLVFDLIIDPDQCNGLECRPGGLFVEQNEDLPGDQGGNAAGLSFGPSAAVNFTTQVGPTVCRTIQNTSQCKSMRVDLTAGWSIDYGRTSGQFTIALQASSDGGATFSDYLQVGNFPPEGATRARGGSYRTGGIAVLPPNGSTTICVRVIATGVNTVGAVITSLDFDLNLNPSWTRG